MGMTMKKPSKKNQIARRRWNLWNRDPHCYYCKKKLKWEETTLEHLYSRVKNGRFKGEREKRFEDVDVYTVLSCSDCNHERQAQEIKELPRWRWWVRSRSFPRFFRKDLTVYERLIILWYQMNLDYKSERV
jgi:hypothetical protein